MADALYDFFFSWIVKRIVSFYKKSRLFFSLKVYCVYMINKIIHGCLQIWNFSSRVHLDTKKYNKQQFIFSCFISYSFADLTLEKVSWTLEEKFHINANQCIILYLLNEDEMAEFVIQPQCKIPEFQRISMRVCGSIALWLVFKQPCNHRLLTTEKVVDECKAIKLNYKFSRKNYLGLELFDCPKVCCVVLEL